MWDCGLSGISMISWVDSLRRFLERHEVEGERQRTALSARLEKVVKQLTKQFPAITRVAVIGSFLTPRLFRADSDIDLVVCGLSGKEYFDALSLLERELQVPVDLIREEALPESARLRLETRWCSMPGREYETIQTLRSELRALLDRVQELDGKLQGYTAQSPQPEALPETVLITVSYLLSGIYSCFEDQFLKIATVFENRVENPASWHRELLERMQIEVEGVRPRVLGRPAFRLLN